MPWPTQAYLEINIFNLRQFSLLLLTSVADPHQKNADADSDRGKNLGADPDADPDVDADSCPY